MPDSTTVTYTYDHAGRRTSQSDGTDTTKYVWDTASMYGDVVVETDGTGTPLASYVLAGNQILSQERGSTTHYFLPDAQGSVRNLSDATGAVTDSYRYTAYGELYDQSGLGTTNNYRYTGQQFDSLTGLYSLRARYYDPGTGRFLSRDTWPLDTFNPVELNQVVGFC